jgi:peptidyl-prolyl cis-trans isomerase D
MPAIENKPVISKKHEVHLNREQKQKRFLLIGLIVTLVLIFGLIGYGLIDQYIIQGLKPIVTVGDTQISTNYFQHIVWFERDVMVQRHADLVKQLDASSGNQFMAYFLNQQIQAYEQNLSSEYAKQIGLSTLSQMIEDTLIKQEAKKRNITVSDEEINRYMQENIFGYFASGTPTIAPTITPFVTSTMSSQQLTLVPYTATPTITATPTAEQTSTAATATATAPSTPTATTNPNATATPTITPYPTETPYTQDAYNNQFSKFLSEGSKAGLSMDDIKTFMSGYIYRDKLTEALSTDVKPQQEQVWVRQILVADETIANDISKRLQKGESFTSLASQYSTDVKTKNNGGDLGWFGRGKLASNVEDAAFTLKIGDISQPINAKDGYHIIQVLGHEVRNLSETEISTIKNGKLNTWLNDQYSKVKITYADNYADKVPTLPALSPEEFLFPTPTSIYTPLLSLTQTAQ